MLGRAANSIQRASSASSIRAISTDLVSAGGSAPSKFHVPWKTAPEKAESSPRPLLGHMSPWPSSSSQRSNQLNTPQNNESQAFSQMYNSLFPQPAPTTPPSNALNDFLKGVDSLSKTAEKRPVHKALSNVFLETKLQELESCESDQQLVQWAAALFQRQNELETAPAASQDNGSTSQSTQTASPVSKKDEFEAYPHLLSALIRTSRDRFCDPHLALAVFNHARTLSLTSFVRGCTTPAYNELLSTLWLCFRDLEGVAARLEEMTANGVEPDERTRELANRILLSDSWVDKREERWRLLQTIETLAGVGQPSLKPRRTRRPHLQG
ncbi:hypothetical protein FRB99_001687 [Tulasnella sp. 403]|nr:hypothetical protein FRB99_001687 [Tulasnella sp. 403]